MAKNEAAKSEAKAVDPAKQQVARALAKILWERDFKKANPQADAAAKREAWAASKGEYVRAGRYLAAKMERAGFTITGPAA